MARQSVDQLPRPDVAGASVNDSGLSADSGSQEAVKFDSRLLKVTAVYMLAPVMAGLDTTIVNVAQRTFVNEFSSTQAVVAWTIECLHPVVGGGDPADRLGR